MKWLKYFMILLFTVFVVACGGYVRFYTNPGNVQVLIDNKYVGNSSKTLPEEKYGLPYAKTKHIEVTSGFHTYTLKKTNYESIKRYFTLEEGQSIKKYHELVLNKLFIKDLILWWVYENQPFATEEVIEQSQSASKVIKLTNDMSDDIMPAISPDGKTITFASRKEDVFDIWKMDVDSERGLIRVVADETNKYSPVWTPDNKYIIFQSDRQGNASLWKVREDGLGGRVRISPGDLDANSPSVSPDYQKIAFCSKGAGKEPIIWTMNLSGSQLTQHTKGDEPKWSPDGKQILFSLKVDDNRQIYLMNSDGSNVAQLTTGKANHINPAWSPDGNKIVFASDQFGNYDIWVMNRDGSKETQLTINKSHDALPVWSRNGDIFFWSNRGKKKWNIWKMTPILE